MKTNFRRFCVMLAVFIAALALGGCVTVDFDAGYEFQTEDYMVGTIASETQAAAEAQTQATQATQATREETKAEVTTQEETETEAVTEPAYVWHEFASRKLFEEHYQKHVVTQQEFGDITEEEYLKLANDLLNGTGENILTKTEDDGDLLFYDVDTNEFAVMRPDGVIRSFFKPSAGIEYWNRQ